VVLINDDPKDRSINFRISGERSKVFIPYTTSSRLDFQKGNEIQSDDDMEVDIPGKSIMTLVQAD